MIIKITFLLFAIFFITNISYSQNYYFKVSGYKQLIFDRDNSKVYEFSQSKWSGLVQFFTYRLSEIFKTDPEANNEIELWETFDSNGKRTTFRVDIPRETIDYIEVDVYKTVNSYFIEKKIIEWEELLKQNDDSNK